MDTQTLFLAKVLGELYRLQDCICPQKCQVDDATIYGLINGFEDTITTEIEKIGFISKEKIDAFHDVLTPYDNGEKEFTGFYDIESKLLERGISRSDFIVIGKKIFTKERYYPNLVSKLDSSNSPIECKKF